MPTGFGLFNQRRQYVFMRPIVGLTTSELRETDPREHIPHADAGREEIVLGAGYIRALVAAGGAPVVRPPIDPDAAPSFLAGVAGVCLSGGPDVDPQWYGAERHPKLGPTEPEVDRFELAVIREVERLGMPLLAICRGAQVLNVAHGGDLIQDLADQAARSARHRRDEPTDPVVWHEVGVEHRGLLAAAPGVQRPAVNLLPPPLALPLGRGVPVGAR